MTFVYTVLGTIAAFNLAWWVWGHWQLRVTRWRWLWRALLGAFVLVMLASVAWVFWGRRAVSVAAPPLALRALTYIWNLVVLPAAVVLAGGVSGVGVAMWGWRKARGHGGVAGGGGRADNPSVAREAQRAENPPPTPSLREGGTEAGEPVLSRRRVLAAAVAAPPAMSGIALAKAMWELDSLRVRELDVAFEGLPRDLDGVTLAHVTDTHVGRYTHGRVLRAIAERVNELRCEAVLFTGDLIDGPQRDIAEGVEMLNLLDRPVYLVEGNHDLFDGRASFDAAVRRAGLPLLLNESRTMKIRGVPVQLLGIRWGSDASGRDPLVEEHVRMVGALRDPDAFQVLLAHHPHAFDHAAELGIPLTLAGHTHGGQLMLAPEVGVGPMMFKYWSGLYRARAERGGASSLVVSNGAGNWFPLRMNAPAEVVKITLRKT